ncbi:MAG TPA: WD40 repeat domain-containing protein, partial [Ktedonobacterales bacterium]
LVQKQIGTPLAVLEGHSDTVLMLSWSPDSALLVSAAADATLRIWDVSQITRGGRGALGGVHRMEAAWWGHDGAIAALDWSPDGTRIASGGADRTIRLWDKAGRALGAWQAHGRGGVSALAWSPDGNTLASGGADHQVMLWDAANHANVLSFEAHHDEIRHLAWSADGRLIASVAGKKDMRVCLWNAQNGQRLAALGGHTREVIGLLWSADATWLATASADRRLRFWSTDQMPGQQLGRPLEIENTPLSMAGSPNSGLIALGLADMMILVLRLTA